MFDIKITDSMWTTIFAYLGTLSWPIIVLALVCILRQSIIKLLENLKTAKWKDLTFEFGDQVTVYSPEDKKLSVGIVQPPSPPLKPVKTKIDMLPQKEINRSKQRALDRIKEDAERVGYERGKPYQLANGKYAVAWNLEVSAKLALFEPFRHFK